MVLSCTQTADPERREKFFPRNLSEAPVLVGSRRPCKDTSLENVRVRHVFDGILPNVNITKHNRDAKSAASVYSGTMRLTVSPTRSRRKAVVKVLLLHSRIPSNFAAYSRLQRRRNSSSFYGRVHNPWNRSEACNLPKKKKTYRQVKIREIMCSSQGVTQHSDPHERVAILPNLKTDLRKKTIETRTMRPQGRVEMANSIHKHKAKDKPHSIRFRKFGTYQCHLRRNPRKETSWWTQEPQCTC